jgi:hypothetical protein
MEDDATATAAAAAAAAEDAVSKVLGDDLLIEVLLRVGFPTTLVRASAVCKRWLHHVSDKAFLRRFRRLNPPRVLGFYIQEFQGYARFMPTLPQPPELAAAVRVVEGYSFGAAQQLVRDCRNGSVSTCGSRYGLGASVGLHSPLCHEKTLAIDRPSSPLQHHPRYPGGPHDFLILTREEEDGGLSYFCVLLENPMELDITSTTNFTAHVFILKDGVWCTLASATTRIVSWQGQIPAALVDDKIYMVPTYAEITVLDLTTSTFSTIQLPQGPADVVISRADDASGVYLVLVKEHQLGIWLLKGGSWSIVDTFCLHEMCANLMMSDSRVKDLRTSPLWINHLGDNAEFVILQMDRFLFYLDTRCRTLHILSDEYSGKVIVCCPFMMI